MTSTATGAYRADIGDTGRSLGVSDDQWVTIASLLEQATFSPEEDRSALIDAAVALARASLRDAARHGHTHSEWGSPEQGSCETLLILADQMFEAAALHLARVVLDAFLNAAPDLSVLEQGRLIARRARIDARLGALAEAADQYTTVGRLGHRTRNPELRIRAWIGHAVLAQMHGNYPEQMRYCRRAARVADRHELRSLSRLAHTGLMITAGARHEFDDALRHGREAYRQSLGDPIAEAEILEGIGQLLLEAGQAAIAADVLASVLRRTLPVRIILPTLGSLAIAEARRGDSASVHWAVAELRRLSGTTRIASYVYASALLDCASALSVLDELEPAMRILDEAVLIAEAHGYHEIVVKADEVRRVRARLEAVPPPRPVLHQGWVTELAEQESERLPRHVCVLSAAE